MAMLLFPAIEDNKLPVIAEKYINAYKDIAISEMSRTGIPASIKLAQGLLESDWGRSALATEANNHFGIKCGNAWNGESFFKEDDDYENGKLVSSCFRSYDSAYQSFMDHSDFLSKPRYVFLYEYDATDYKSWAKGLKKAGYATDRKYPSKLISIIEKYELYIYDTEIPDGEIYADSSPTHIEDDEVITFKDEETYRSQHMEAVEITANSETSNSSQYIGQNFHIVSSKENMRDIARMHHIDIKKLYAMNRMPIGSEPVEGEMLKLTGKLRLDTKVKYVRFPTQADPDSVFLF